MSLFSFFDKFNLCGIEIKLLQKKILRDTI